MKKLTIATRGSKLALWQAHHTRDRLIEASGGDLEVEILVLKTKGDKILDVPLAKVGGKGLFVKEIETALLDGRADVAVHSMKDVPAELEPGLHMVAVSERAEPRDAFCSSKADSLQALAQGSVVGTSSLRRGAQVLALRPDLKIKSLRGNVPTRLDKLDAGGFDAIILAAAGLERLGFANRITAKMSLEDSLPAVGQGALGIEGYESRQRCESHRGGARISPRSRRWVPGAYGCVRTVRRGFSCDRCPGWRARWFQNSASESSWNPGAGGGVRPRSCC